MMKHKTSERIYTSLTPALSIVRSELLKMGYSDSEMLKEGLRCLAKREGLLSAELITEVPA